MVAAAEPMWCGMALRILLVEDNYLIAHALAAQLAGLGCEVVGPATSEGAAMDLIAAERLHGAILDINIHGGTSIDIALRLRRAECPFVFITGYGNPRVLPEELRDATRIDKPVTHATLVRIVDEEFRSGEAWRR